VSLLSPYACDREAAAGRPVLAAAAGGALETVIDGQTGCFANLDDVDSFAQAMRDLDELAFDPARAVEKRRALLGGLLPAPARGVCEPWSLITPSGATRTGERLCGLATGGRPEGVPGRFRVQHRCGWRGHARRGTRAVATEPAERADRW
jgi:hypothetical protein